MTGGPNPARRTRAVRAGSRPDGLRAILAIAVTAIALGCAAPRPDPADLVPTPTPVPAIRIGMSPDAPPFSFRQGGRPAGIDVDLATYLGQELQRPLRVYPMQLDELVPALLDKRIDIVMSGMTASRLRELQVDFGASYLASGVAVLARRADASRFRSPGQAIAEAGRIGVVRGTAGEKYAREHAPEAQVFAYANHANAVAELTQRRVDAVVADAPTVAWYAASDEGALLPLLSPPLTTEPIAWGFRPQSRRLRERADAAIERWKADGTLDKVLGRWLPGWRPARAEGGPAAPSRRKRR